MGFVSNIPGDWSLSVLPSQVVLYVSYTLILVVIAYQLVGQTGRNVDRLYAAESLQKKDDEKSVRLY